MRSLFVIAALVFAFAMSVQAQSPLEFYKRVSAFNDSLYLKGQVWSNEKMLIDQGKHGSYDDLEPFRKDIEDYVEGELTWLKSRSNTIDFEPLKTAAIDFLVFQQELIKAYFIPLEKLTKSSTEEEQRTVQQAGYEQMKKENAVQLKLASAAHQFAEKNNIPEQSGAEAQQKD